MTAFHFGIIIYFTSTRCKFIAFLFKPFIFFIRRFNSKLEFQNSVSRCVSFSSILLGLFLILDLGGSCMTCSDVVSILE
ncbi:hypothetical protein D3C81_1624940 [compost metagenome]